MSKLADALRRIATIDAAANGLTGFAAELVDSMAADARAALAADGWQPLPAPLQEKP